MTNINKTYQDFIFYRTYSRWNWELGRRETWDETIDRYRDFWLQRIPIKLKDEFLTAVEMIRKKEIMPSMRLLWTAGEAVMDDNICAYNCSYRAIDDVKAFAEVLYILMNGTGVGVSVERQFVNQLPNVPNHLDNKEITVVFKDSKLGWAEGLYHFMKYLYDGVIPLYDVSKVRPRGAILKTFGGRASGAKPLIDLLEFIKQVFINAKGRKLTSEECADIVCKIADIVVVGGVRRSSIIIGSNVSDMRMRNYKQGEYWLTKPYRAMANISAVYTEKPDIQIFMEEWTALMKSQAGERGIINREGFQKKAKELGRDESYQYFCNPCAEIILKSKEFCNLTEVVCRPEDDYKSIMPKVKYATLLGTLQATLDDFKFLGKEWKNNVQDERLLGVSLTGICDSPFVFNAEKDILKDIKSHARYWNGIFAATLGINKAKAVTCVKPSGTVSQLVMSSSGIHPAYAPYYIRRVRVSTTDPMCKFLIDMGVPNSPEVGQSEKDCTTRVFEFPIHHKSNVYRNDMNALEQLEFWKKFKENYTDHNPSVTIYVKDEEWLEVGAWVYKNWDVVGGLSFLPYDGGVYTLAPYEEIDKQRYEELLAKFPKNIDFTKLTEYEKDDYTTGAKEYACVGGACGIN